MAAILRNFIERRSHKNRRRILVLRRPRIDSDQRCGERRSTEERRNGWIRISKWSSAPLKKLKIAKYLVK